MAQRTAVLQAFLLSKKRYAEVDKERPSRGRSGGGSGMLALLSPQWLAASVILLMPLWSCSQQLLGVLKREQACVAPSFLSSSIVEWNSHSLLRRILVIRIRVWCWLVEFIYFKCGLILRKMPSSFWYITYTVIKHLWYYKWKCR